MTRIVVDLLFMTGRRGGMETYVRELYARLPAEMPGVEFIALASAELAQDGAAWFPGRVIDTGVRASSRGRWALGELLLIPRLARRERADLVHCPANFGPRRSAMPVVLTLHDVLGHRHPEFVPGAHAPLVRRLVEWAARGAARILTVSRASADDIVDLLGIDAARVVVTPLSGGQATAADDRPAVVDAARQRPVLLAAGNRMPHKNLERLLEALALIPLAERPQLILTGGGEGDALLSLVARLGLHDRVRIAGWVSAEELEELYQRATLIVQPTLFEGFGLPVLEAMARGRPVLCSDLPVLREVGGEAALYMDTTDPGLIAEAIKDALADRARLDVLAVRGRERASRFTWQRTATQTAAVFYSVLA